MLLEAEDSPDTRMTKFVVPIQLPTPTSAMQRMPPGFGPFFLVLIDMLRIPPTLENPSGLLLIHG